MGRGAGRESAPPVMAGPMFLGAPLGAGGRSGAPGEVRGREAWVWAPEPRWARGRGVGRRRRARGARWRGGNHAPRPWLARFFLAALGGWGGAMSVTRGGQGDSSRPPVPKATPATREGLRRWWEARAGRGWGGSAPPVIPGPMFLGAPLGGRGVGEAHLARREGGRRGYGPPYRGKHAGTASGGGRRRVRRMAGSEKAHPESCWRFFFAASPARLGVSCGTRAARALDLGHGLVWRREPRGRASRGRGRYVRGVAGGGKPHLQNGWRDFLRRGAGAVRVSLRHKGRPWL